MRNLLSFALLLVLMPMLAGCRGNDASKTPLQTDVWTSKGGKGWQAPGGVFISPEPITLYASTNKDSQVSLNITNTEGKVWTSYGPTSWTPGERALPPLLPSRPDYQISPGTWKISICAATDKEIVEDSCQFEVVVQDGNATTFPNNLLTSVLGPIRANPKAYEGQPVTVVGQYVGWQGPGAPPRTKSDWAVADKSGAIYVIPSQGAQWTGHVPNPMVPEDKDTVLRIEGHVRITPEGQAYLEATRLETLPRPTPTVQYALSVTDDTGRTVNLRAIPKRIVSIGPIVTDFLVALGASNKIVGIDNYSYLPNAPASFPRLGQPYLAGDVIGPNLGIDPSAIVSLHPDLVIVSVGTWVRASKDVPSGTRFPFPDFDKTGVPIMYLDSNAGIVSATPRMLRSLGVVTGESDKANALVAGYEERKQAVVDRVKDLPRVHVALARGHGGGPSAPGLPITGDDPFSEVIQLAGGVNVFTSSPEDKQLLSKLSIDPWSNEPYIAKNPEVLVVFGGGLDMWRLKSPGWDKVDAVRTGRVYEIGALTPFTALDRLEEIARILHP